MEANEKKDLAVIVNESGLNPTKAKYLLENFQEYFEIADDWEKKAKAIVVTKDDQIAEMKMAREGRLFLREKRITIENARKKLKEESLREGKAIDGIANILKALIVPIEQYLDDQEHFIENKKKAEEAARKEEAERLLREKEEADRVAREEEQKRIAAENERLKAEAEAREKKMEEERRAAEEAMRKEREAAEARLAEERKREREEAERRIAEERKIAAEKAAKEKAEAEARAKMEREELEARLLEEKRLASMATCPKCGHVFSTID